MKILRPYKFEEVLNDLMNYFILGDADYLLQYKAEQHLPDDLLTEFTTQETGDDAVKNGVLVPITGVENHPYTVYFNLSDDTPELLKPENELEHRQDGYCLKVTSGRIYLYTMPYLKLYTAERLIVLKNHKHATIDIPNGWYSVSVLAGFTKQSAHIENINGESEILESMEPTFEFLIQQVFDQPEYTADFNYQFNL
jgi:hypothetical protein